MSSVSRSLSSYISAALLVTAGSVLGSLLTLTIVFRFRDAARRDKNNDDDVALQHAQARRRRLPRLIILVRHGESEANADKLRWRTIPDNLLGLTERGRAQATAIGQRVETILEENQLDRVHLVVSPFERTLQTAAQMRPAFENRIVRTDIESRIREQEMGNLQGDEFQAYRREQQKVGRFWYRFPTGVSQVFGFWS